MVPHKVLPRRSYLGCANRTFIGTGSLLKSAADRTSATTLEPGHRRKALFGTAKRRLFSLSRRPTRRKPARNVDRTLRESLYDADLEPIGLMYAQFKEENSASGTMGALLACATLQGSAPADA
jgi:hypothetical protein